MRNFYHIIIGFAIAYLAFIILGINLKEFPITIELFTNALTPLLGGVISAIPAFFWERWQERKFNAPFDLMDIFRTAIGGIIGGALAMFFVSWWLAIPMVLVSGYLVVFHYKK